MAFTGFAASDFRAFDIKGFQPRMSAIRAQIRPSAGGYGGSRY